MIARPNSIATLSEFKKLFLFMECSKPLESSQLNFSSLEKTVQLPEKMPQWLLHCFLFYKESVVPISIGYKKKTCLNIVASQFLYVTRCQKRARTLKTTHHGELEYKK